MKTKNQNRFSGRLPDFLVIGAMKCGTTSLAADLQAHTGIFVPSVKEPHFLCDTGALTKAGTRQYARLFDKAAAAQICGEASTGYTKLPDITGVAQRAKSLLGSELRLIYMVRHPVNRAISHHYHLVRSGDACSSIDEAIENVPQLLNYSRYATQLQPWVEAFGIENIQVICFEDYVIHRPDVLSRVSEFLGVEHDQEWIDRKVIKNQGSDAPGSRPALNGVKRWVTHSRWYKLYVHPYFPSIVKDALRPAFFRRPQPHPAPPSAETVKRIERELSGEAKRIQALAGSERPFWNLGSPETRTTVASRGPASATDLKGGIKWA